MVIDNNISSFFLCLLEMGDTCWKVGNNPFEPKLLKFMSLIFTSVLCCICLQVRERRATISAGAYWYLCQYSGSSKGTTIGDSQCHSLNSRGWLPSWQSVMLFVRRWCVHADFWCTFWDIRIRTQVGAILQEVQHWTSCPWNVLLPKDRLFEGQSATHIRQGAPCNEG